MTAAVAAQKAEIENLKYLEVILDASFDALFVINDQGIIQKVNAASMKVFGWTMDELIGQNINIIMPEEHARQHDSYLESKSSIDHLWFDYGFVTWTDLMLVSILDYARTGIKKMIGTQREVEARRKDGTVFPCILGLSELGRNGDGHEQYVGFIRDVTLQKSLLAAEFERDASELPSVLLAILV
jgi:PAS domain-containing protein